MGSTQTIDAAFRREQLQQHRDSAATSALGAGVLAALLSAKLWHSVDTALLAGWLALLGLALVLRLAVAWSDQRAPATEPRRAVWLWRYRAAFAGHGLVWGLAGAMLLPAATPADFTLLAFALVAVAAGSLLVSAFDGVATAAFSVPALAPLAMHLFTHSAERSPVVAPLLVLFIAIASLIALRTQRAAREALRLRLAAAERGEQARRHAEQAEAALRTYEVVTNSITDLVSVIDEDRIYRLVNDAWCRHTGIARVDAIGRRTEDVLPADVPPERRQALRETIELQQIRVVRGNVALPGMPGGHFETTYYPYIDTTAGGRCAVVVTRDVAAQEASRVQLADSAEYLRQTLNATGDAIFAVDAQSQDEPLRFVNERMLQMWGIPPEQAASLTPADITAYSRPLWFDPQAEARRVDAIVAANVAHEDRLQLRDGRSVLRRCIPTRLGERTLRVWSFRDITTEERARQLMQASEAEQRALLDAFPGFITRVDANLVYSYVNGPVAARLGTTPEQMIGRTVGEVVGPEREAWLRGFVERALAGEPVTYERSHMAGDGVELTDQVTLVVGVEPRTGGTAIYAFGVDITDRKRAEQELRRTGEQLSRKTLDLQVTLDSIAQGIISFDADGHVDVYNRRALELLDLPESLMASQFTVDDILRYQIERGELNEDASFIDAEGRRHAIRGGLTQSPEVYLRRTRAGALLEVRTRQLAGGGVVRTFADVTAYADVQQALHAQQAEMRALLDAFPGYIGATDQDFVYTYVNARLAAVLGRAPQQIIGQHASDIVGEERFNLNAQQIRLAIAGEQAVAERSYDSAGEQPRLDLEVTHVAGPLQASGRRTLFAFGIDITARKRAEAALIVARDEAERANRAKSRFLSQMSHELRTPMNAVLGFGQLLESDRQHPLTAQQQSHVHEILRGARHLLELINEVLDLGRIEAGDLRVQSVPVGLCETIDDCLALVRPLAQAHAVRVLPPQPALLHEHVLGDRTRLKQVLLNLLANAIKYNRPGGHVAIACSAHGAAWRLAVRDTGRGLTADEQERLFQPFERLSAGQTDIEGTGIGLALSRRLVQAMGGTIGVASQVGQGSTFWIELAQADALARPAAASVSAPAPAAPAVATDSASRTVLYIEDNPVNVILMQAMLARLPGLRILAAALPLEGLALAHSERPDVVLLDIQLPGIDGFEVLRRLRASERTRAIPVVAVSANALQADIDAGLAAGFADYLTKPIELARLLAVVQRALQPAG